MVCYPLSPYSLLCKWLIISCRAVYTYGGVLVRNFDFRKKSTIFTKIETTLHHVAISLLEIFK